MGAAGNKKQKKSKHKNKVPSYELKEETKSDFGTPKHKKK